MPKRKEPPPGACRQCYHHVEGGGHKSNWGGLFGEPKNCPKCTDHYENGCPPHMIVPPKRGFGWW